MKSYHPLMSPQQLAHFKAKILPLASRPQSAALSCSAKLLTALCLLNASGCSNSLVLSKQEEANTAISQAQSPSFKTSGTIILSQRPPAVDTLSFNTVSNKGTDGLFDSDIFDSTAANNPDSTDGFAPLIGYFPPAATYLPADNETWLEIDKEKKTISLYKGTNVIKSFAAEGEVSLAKGDYFLSNKQKEPKWYATDEYFLNRKLEVPEKSDKLRYRNGALGKFALYPAPNFPIHCAKVWTPEVGGLKVSGTDLASIFYMLQVGAPVVVR